MERVPIRLERPLELTDPAGAEPEFTGHLESSAAGHQSVQDGPVPRRERRSPAGEVDPESGLVRNRSATVPGYQVRFGRWHRRRRVAPYARHSAHGDAVGRETQPTRVSARLTVVLLNDMSIAKLLMEHVPWSADHRAALVRKKGHGKRHGKAATDFGPGGVRVPTARCREHVRSFNSQLIPDWLPITTLLRHASLRGTSGANGCRRRST